MAERDPWRWRLFELGLVAMLLGLGTLGTLPGCATQRPAAAAGPLAVGTPVPDLHGVDQNGGEHRLRELTGKVLVVYFYPKDGTPGCTKEACAFRDVWDQYSSAGVVVLGVSRDSRESHARFAAQHRLSFPLIDDENGTWESAFGVPSRLGLSSRVTFLIGRDGKIAKTFLDVDPGVHAREVLEAARALP